MGVDAVIWFKANGPVDLERGLPKGYEIIEAVPGTLTADVGATHEIGNMDRYYGKGYERVPWADICATLMLLFACPQVEIVWYGGDADDFLPECSREKVLEISMHYMMHGERPYREQY